MSVVSSFFGGHAKKKKRAVMDNAIRNLKSVSPAQIKKDMGPFQQKVSGMQTRGNQMFAQGQQFIDQGQAYADPRGAHQQELIGQLTEQTGDAAATAAATQSQLMAQRGMGGGGISSLLQATNAAQATESLRTGMQGIRQQGFQQMQAMSQMGMQSQQQGGGLLGQAMGAQGKIQENIAQARIAQQNLENQKNMQLAQSEADSIRSDSLSNFGLGGIFGGGG